MAGEKPKLTLEEYVAFFDTRDRRYLTVDLLNQVVSLHGFTRFRTKKAIIAALSPLDLIPPWRSTLCDGTTTSTPLELDEIKEDITAIGWQECPFGSILTVGDAIEEAVGVSSSAASEQPTTTTHKKKKKKRFISIASLTATWGTKKRRNCAWPAPLSDAGPLLLLADHAVSESDKGC